MEKKIITEKGFLQDAIPFNIYTELLQSLNVDNIDSKKIKYNDSLAGNIESEFNVTDLVPTSFYNYVAYLAEHYYYYFPREDMSIIKGIKKKLKFKFDSAWLNYQKKLEFNPIHMHFGSLSYVVWIKIPYNIEEELGLPNSKNANVPRNSAFSFFVDNNEHPIFVNKNMIGQIIIFNSGYWHQVHPFYTSDEYRISLAGNLFTHWVD